MSADCITGTQNTAIGVALAKAATAAATRLTAPGSEEPALSVPAATAVPAAAHAGPTGSDHRSEPSPSSSTPPAPSKLLVRQMHRLEEAEWLCPLVETIHAETRFGDIPFSPDKFERQFKRMLADRQRHCVLVAEREGHPLGLIYCSAGEYLFGTGTNNGGGVLTTVHAFNVASDVRNTLLGGRVAVRLLSGVVKWSKARGSRECWCT